MMVDARAFDAAKIGEEDGGKVRVILPQEVGNLAKEVQCLDDPDDKCQNRTRQLLSTSIAPFTPSFFSVRAL